MPGSSPRNWKRHVVDRHWVLAAAARETSHKADLIAAGVMLTRKSAFADEVVQQASCGCMTGRMIPCVVRAGQPATFAAFGSEQLDESGLIVASVTAQRLARRRVPGETAG